MDDQKGMGSILGVLIIFVTLSMGTVLLNLASTETEIATNFIEGLKAQQIAEAGAQHAIARLKNDKEFAKNTNSAMIMSAPALQSNSAFFNEGKYSVHIMGSMNKRVILSIGEVRKVKRQIIVHVNLPDEQNDFSVVSWNNE